MHKQVAASVYCVSTMMSEPPSPTPHTYAKKKSSRRLHYGHRLHTIALFRNICLLVQYICNKAKIYKVARHSLGVLSLFLPLKQILFHPISFLNCIENEKEEECLVEEHHLFDIFQL